MSAAVRVLRSEAIELARELVTLLDPLCERLIVAGSLRRKLATAGDIDIVCVPRITPMTDMFGQATATGVDLLDAELDNLCGAQVIRQRRDANGRTCWGKLSKRGVYRDVPVDITSCDADSFGMHVLIRTGPADYTHAFVTPRSQTALLRDKDGHIVGTRPGTLPPGFEIKDGFRLYRAGGLVPTPNEHDVYDALGLPYVDAWKRR